MPSPHSGTPRQRRNGVSVSNEKRSARIPAVKIGVAPDPAKTHFVLQVLDLPSVWFDFAFTYLNFRLKTDPFSAIIYLLDKQEVAR